MINKKGLLSTNLPMYFLKKVFLAVVAVARQEIRVEREWKTCRKVSQVMS